MVVWASRAPSAPWRKRPRAAPSVTPIPEDPQLRALRELLDAEDTTRLPEPPSAPPRPAAGKAGARSGERRPDWQWSGVSRVPGPPLTATVGAQNQRDNPANTCSASLAAGNTPTQRDCWRPTGAVCCRHSAHGMAQGQGQLPSPANESVLTERLRGSAGGRQAPSSLRLLARGRSHPLMALQVSHALACRWPGKVL